MKEKKKRIKKQTEKARDNNQSKQKINFDRQFFKKLNIRKIKKQRKKLRQKTPKNGRKRRNQEEKIKNNSKKLNFKRAIKKKQ